MKQKGELRIGTIVSRLMKGSDSSDELLPNDYSQELSHYIEKATKKYAKPPKKNNSRGNNHRPQNQLAGVNFERALLFIIHKLIIFRVQKMLLK